MAALTMRRCVSPACAKAFAREVHPATLPGGLEDLGHRSLDALVAVAHDDHHTAQAATVQASKQLGPERLGFAVPSDPRVI